ncbi:MAG: DNA methyltransferase [Planctomycetota bacterium]|nr:DNA methyltransferase [Planctomycetota bacterium]
MAQFDLGFPVAARPTELPSYEEISSPEDLRDANALFARLKSHDWSFTEDDTRYLSHDLHPYPAKFIPQIPGTLISLLSLRGEIVLDPFGGSGTTALEAVRLGRRAISVDANPLAALIGRTKTRRLSKDDREDIRSVAAALRTRLPSLAHDPKRLLQEFGQFVPEIPNTEKWFPVTSCGELALIRAHIERVESAAAKDVCLIALSRVVLKASFQDSETRYASKPHNIPPGVTVRSFLDSLEAVARKVLETSSELQYGIAQFHTMDTRQMDRRVLPGASVDLVVTSPPYGNANDYHLYHRFRIFWLGFDPRVLAKIEIGSHLRHQKERTGFADYIEDMAPCLTEIHRVLKPGRYAALVVGDAIYDGKQFSSIEALGERARKYGFEQIGIVERPIHKTKRSFVAAARRAEHEGILILRKPDRPCAIRLLPPEYKLWPYEELIRIEETRQLLGKTTGNGGPLLLKCDSHRAANARRLAFTHSIVYESHTEPTWQKILENGLTCDKATRKDPKYVTHGIHAYKGKFYPQLAKGLINVSGVQQGARVLDPFCGSGTTLLESFLNGLQAYGCDMHPLAAKISQAKVGVLQLDPLLVAEAASLLMSKLSPTRPAIPQVTDELPVKGLDEIFSWFPKPVVYKLNWLLGRIRSISTGVLQDFFETLLSDLIREVSQQDPADLRIRRRKEPLEDADVLSLYEERLTTHMARLERFWATRGHCPYRFYPASILNGDSRNPETFSSLGLTTNNADLVLTSPPYATALPYIDTDRLSLLVLFGMNSGARRPLETGLSGSREITRLDRKQLDEQLFLGRNLDLPAEVCDFLRDLYESNSADSVGFRRRNLPALLLRFFWDMKAVLLNCRACLKPGAQAMIVVGDSYTIVDGKQHLIPTTAFLESIGRSVGLESLDQIEITVTTDNHKHIKNAITRNVVLRMKCPAT